MLNAWVDGQPKQTLGVVRPPPLPSGVAQLPPGFAVGDRPPIRVMSQEFATNWYVTNSYKPI
jgi:hypothetical protein